MDSEKVFGSITENELKEYASLVRYYSEKSKSDNKGKEIGFDLRKIQKNGEILKKIFIQHFYEYIKYTIMF